MTNPSPRPALRKAADSDVHPAAPRPARSARHDVTPVARPREEPPTPPSPRPTGTKHGAPKHGAPKHGAPKHGAPKRAFTGATSDHLRVPDVHEAGGGSAQRSALDALFEGERPSGGDKARAPKAKAPKEKRPVDLMSGKPVDLGARVPKALRKAARDEAKARGLDVDAVVTDLLHAWLTERR